MKDYETGTKIKTTNTKLHNFDLEKRNLESSILEKLENSKNFIFEEIQSTSSDHGIIPIKPNSLTNINTAEMSNHNTEVFYITYTTMKIR